MARTNLFVEYLPEKSMKYGRIYNKLTWKKKEKKNGKSENFRTSNVLRNSQFAFRKVEEAYVDAISKLMNE